MKKLVLLLMLMAGFASAALTDVSGPNSNLGYAAEIISAPSHAEDDNVTNSAMQGFDEVQNVILSKDYAVDFSADGSGKIHKGTRVSSHMIFLNSESTTYLEHNDVVWTFDGDILGIMYDRSGKNESASTGELGLPTTVYSTFGGRGFESNDVYSVSGNQLTLSMLVTEPGDWIRVVTASPVPAPGALLMASFGTFAVGRFRRRML